MASSRRLACAVRRILALQNDLGLRLGAWPVRFEAPVPGKRVVGLEVPNQSVQVVAIRGLLESEAAGRVRSKLKLALGQDVSGRPVVADLTRMPHLLIAGATGSGKSVCINSILASLLSQSTPDELQLLMIDPKMVELMPFSGIPHLRMPVVTDMDQVVGALKWVVREMERRYALFVQQAARNIEGFNRAVEDQPGQRPLPYLVVVIDELADMMMTAAGRRRGLDLSSGPEGPGHRDPPDRGHPAPLGRRTDRHDQGELRRPGSPSPFRHRSTRA